MTAAKDSKESGSLTTIRIRDKVCGSNGHAWKASNVVWRRRPRALCGERRRNGDAEPMKDRLMMPRSAERCTSGARE